MASIVVAIVGVTACVWDLRTQRIPNVLTRAQALRLHAEAARNKRRQRAEERAANAGVKLVFPLVCFLFPAFYVVTLGPAMLQFMRAFTDGLMPALK